VPDEFRICIFKVSFATAAVSFVSICNQNESIALVALEGMLTGCMIVSVCVEPHPSSQAFHDPVCGASNPELSITPAVTVQGDGLLDPFSNPELLNNCCAVVIVKFMFVECVCPPPVPVTVTLYEPGGVDAPAVMVKFDDPLPGAPNDEGANVAVAPEGNPVADNVTVELNPPESVEVIVAVPEAPRAIVIVCGDEDSVKVGLKTMSMIGCSSIAFGATPSCPS